MSQRKQALEQNLWKIELNAFLINFLVYAPILSISFQEKGFSYAQIGLLFMLASVSLLFEVPMGMLSDRWSRKLVLTIAAIFGVLSMLFWSGEVFVFLALGTILRSLMLASVSGSDTALLYDTLEELKRKKEYGKYNARRFSAGIAAFGLAAITASLISTEQFYRQHFVITAIALLCSAVLMLTVTEPRVHRHIDKPLSHLKSSFKTATRHPEVYKIVRYAIGISATMIMVFMYMQFFLKDAGVDPKHFGIIYAGFALASFVAGRNAHRIQEWLGRAKMILIMPCVLAAGILLLIIGSTASIIILGLLLIEILFGIQGSIINGYLQEHLVSEQRASVESIQSLLGGLHNAVILFVLGIIATVSSIQVAFLCLLAIWAMLIIPPTYFLLQKS